MKQRAWTSIFAIALTAVIAISGITFHQATQGAEAVRRDGRGQSEPQARKLEGTWRLQITIRNCQTGDALLPPFPALVTFARGGTLTSADGSSNPASRSPGHGIWQQTGGHTYSALSEAFLFNSAGAWSGTQRLTQVIEIGEDPDEYHANISAEIFAPNGNLLTIGCATSVGQRMK